MQASRDCLRRQRDRIRDGANLSQGARVLRAAPSYQSFSPLAGLQTLLFGRRWIEKGPNALMQICFLAFIGVLWNNYWWAVLGSNQRPLPCEGSALPLRLTARERREFKHRSGRRVNLRSVRILAGVHPCAHPVECRLPSAQSDHDPHPLRTQSRPAICTSVAPAPRSSPGRTRASTGERSFCASRIRTGSAPPRLRPPPSSTRWAGSASTTTRAVPPDGASRSLPGGRRSLDPGRVRPTAATRPARSWRRSGRRQRARDEKPRYDGRWRPERAIGRTPPPRR